LGCVLDWALKKRLVKKGSEKNAAMAPSQASPLALRSSIVFRIAFNIAFSIFL